MEIGHGGVAAPTAVDSALSADDLLREAAWDTDLEDLERSAHVARSRDRRNRLEMKTLEFAQAFLKGMMEAEPAADGSLWKLEEIVGIYQDVDAEEDQRPDSPTFAEEVAQEGTRRALVDILDWMDAEETDSIGADGLAQLAKDLIQEHDAGLGGFQGQDQHREALDEVLATRRWIDQASDEDLAARQEELERRSMGVRGFDGEERELHAIEHELEQRPWRNGTARNLLAEAEAKARDLRGFSPLLSDATPIRALIGGSALQIVERGLLLRDNPAFTESSPFAELLRVRPGMARARMIADWFRLAGAFEEQFEDDVTEDAVLRADLRAKASILLVAEAENLVELFRQSRTAGDPERAEELARFFDLLLDPGTAIDVGSMKSADDLVARNLSLFLARNLAILRDVPDDAALRRMESEDPVAAGRIKHRLQGAGAVVAAFDEANRRLTESAIERAEAVRARVEGIFDLGIQALGVGRILPIGAFRARLGELAGALLEEAFPADLFEGRDQIVEKTQEGLMAVAESAAAPAFEAAAGNLLGRLSPAEFVRREQAKWRAAQVDRRELFHDVFERNFHLDDPRRASLQNEVRIGMGLANDARRAHGDE